MKVRSRAKRKINKKRRTNTKKKLKNKSYNTLSKSITNRGGGINNIPVFIISYNQYTYLKSMIEQLSKYPNMTIYVIDNKSTYPPLVEYLKSIEGTVKVLYQPENYGHTVYERDDIIALGGDKYIVTDPDLLLNPKLPNNFIEILCNLSDKYKTNKIGFALDIKNNINLNRKVNVTANNSGMETSNQWLEYKGLTIPGWEERFWKDRVEDPDYELYKAFVDTTFGLINKAYYQKGKMDNCLRIAGDFTAVHRTWLNDYEKELQDGEYEYYLGKNNKSSTTKLWKNNSIKGNKSGGGGKYINHAHVISLDSSTDRFDELNKQASKAGLELKRFVVVKPSIDSIKNMESFLKVGGNTFIGRINVESNPDLLGTIGCFLSHRSLLAKISSEESMNKIAMILEDDAIIPDDLIPKLNIVIESLPKDWHLCFLGKSDVDSEPYKHNIVKLSNRFNPFKNYGTWAYLVNISHIKTILQCLERISDPIDTQYNYYSDRIHTYLVRPNIVNVNMEVKSTRTE